MHKEQWVMLEENDVVGFRNPHGNPSGGEYRMRYQDSGAGGGPGGAVEQVRLCYG